MTEVPRIEDITQVRCLSRPGQAAIPETYVVPRGSDPRSIETRQVLGAFLDATMVRPLHFNDHDRDTQINTALNTMTLTECVFIEIEMMTRAPSVHSFDYDPLR